jgi:hypothetical protein
MIVIGVRDQPTKGIPIDEPLTAETFPQMYLYIKGMAVMEAMEVCDDALFRTACHNDAGALVHALKGRIAQIKEEYDAASEEYVAAAQKFDTEESSARFEKALYKLDALHQIKQMSNELAVMVGHISDFLDTNPGYYHYSVEEAMAAVRKKREEAEAAST